MHRRSWPEITTDILETTLTPSNKMRIMYRANLNFERFNKYFHNLLRKGFIEEKTATMDDKYTRSLKPVKNCWTSLDRRRNSFLMKNARL